MKRTYGGMQARDVSSGYTGRRDDLGVCRGCGRGTHLEGGYCRGCRKAAGHNVKDRVTFGYHRFGRV